MGAMLGLGALGWGQQGQRGGGTSAEPPWMQPYHRDVPPVPTTAPHPRLPKHRAGPRSPPRPQKPTQGPHRDIPGPKSCPPHHRAPLTVGQVLLEEHGRVRRQLQRPREAFPRPRPRCEPRGPVLCTGRLPAARLIWAPPRQGGAPATSITRFGDVWGGFYGMEKGVRTGGTRGTRVAAPRLCPFGVPQRWRRRDDEATSPGVVSPQLLLSPILGSLARPHVPLMSLL